MMDIKHLSKLANLKLSKSEQHLYQIQLENIISFISHLNEIDVSEVNLEADKEGIFNVYSEDKIKGSLAVDEVLFNASSKHDSFFKVGMVLKNKRL